MGNLIAVGSLSSSVALVAIGLFEVAIGMFAVAVAIDYFLVVLGFVSTVVVVVLALVVSVVFLGCSGSPWLDVPMGVVGTVSVVNMPHSRVLRLHAGCICRSSVDGMSRPSVSSFVGVACKVVSAGVVC